MSNTIEFEYKEINVSSVIGPVIKFEIKGETATFEGEIKMEESFQGCPIKQGEKISNVDNPKVNGVSVNAQYITINKDTLTIQL